VGERRSRAALVALALAATFAALFWRAHGAVRADLDRERDLHGEGFVGSTVCRRCHEDHHESWARTHHRRMTQEPSDDTVLGPFDGSALRYRGWEATMARRDEAFVITVRDEDGEVVSEDRVAMTIGSRRVQQYVAERDGVFVRLPVAWHVEEGRWMHMNGAFLTADPEGVDFERHVTRWNDNCVFCHNVGPNPGLRDGAGEPRFETEVAELGVACEACHGPGAEHVARNQGPLRRYVLHLGDEPDPTIVNPGRLDADRSADVCGRCHGQRKAADVRPFLRRGDPFVPGDDLALFSEPLWRDTELNGEALFAARFWPDGTPRLTAYEYQGWLQSDCTQEGSLSCTTCHGMHGADPKGQVRQSATHEGRLGDGACIDCHEGPGTDDHAAHDGAVACVDCHMPKVVYGVIAAHRSHRIDTPDVRLTNGRADTGERPDACLLCHLDWGEDWGTRALFGGDPVERAVVASAWGRSTAVDPDRARGVLLEAMASDPYPAVRRIAFRALRERTDDAPDWIRFDPTGREGTRRAQVRALAATTAHDPPDPATVASLRTLAETQAIAIGE
jgi:hypothetical protein